nr:T9SS type A sorting domain-containing protein [Hymenobacter translucens]
MRSFFCLLSLVGGLALTSAASAQSLALLDDFNRPDDPTLGLGWVETETTAGTGVSITSGQLKISSGVLGKDFATRDISGRYSAVLNANVGELNWAWNMQQSRINPSGFGSNNYGQAFVLAASSANLLTASGYAVLLGNTSTPDNIRLVRFTGGLTAEANLTTLLSTSGTDYANKPMTIRVAYAADDDTWRLLVSPNTTSFDDPLTATYTQVGATIDATLTGQALPFMGCFWNHATTATEAAVFDNIYLSTPCTVGPEPTQAASITAVTTTSTTATFTLSPGNGTSRLLVVRAPGASLAAPVDGNVYPAGTAYGSGAPLGAGAYSVLSGSGTSVTVTGLQPATTYSYQVYEALGSGCAINYLTAQAGTGTFLTGPCQIATAPTASATAMTAASPGRGTLTFAWQNGNGSGRLVTVRPSSASATLPLNGMSYAASLFFGSGSALAPGEYVVYTGAGSSVTVNNLIQGQTYTATVYEFNGVGCSTAYRALSPATVTALVPVLPAPTYAHYYGNLHAHSAYSDGNQDGPMTGYFRPGQDYAFADASLHADFLGISEHNHSQAGMLRPNYAKGLHQADSMTVPGQFVALYGMEWGVISGGGHVLVYGVDQLLGWEPGNYDRYVARNDYQGLWKMINRFPGGFATLAHPQSGDYNALAGSATPFNPAADSALVGTAFRSGPANSTNVTYSNPSNSSFESTFRTLLAKGYHVSMTLDHDNHNTTFLRTTAGRTVVLAPTLSKPDLLQALRARRFYASDDWNAEVTFTVDGQPMGTIFQGPATPAASVTIADIDGENVTSLTLLKGTPGSGAAATVVATAPAGSNALSFSDATLAVGASAYYYAVVVQADGDRIITSPIWYTRQLGTPVRRVIEPLAMQVFPNPATGSAVTVSYFLPQPALVEVQVLDALGRVVLMPLPAQRQSGGAQALLLPAGALAAGSYTLRVQQNGQASYRRLLVR